MIGIEAITRAEIEAGTEMESVVETGVGSKAKVWEQRLQVEDSRPVVKALSRHCDRDIGKETCTEIVQDKLAESFVL